MKETKTPSLFEAETTALTAIRTETALSRFPLHRLTTGRDIQIELKNQGGATHWKVSPNSEYGQPGQLAYKIDTLLINRRIQEAGRSIPNVIRLGTLPEIARELGVTTRNWEAVRHALLQNASAFITAKLTYRTADKTEKWLEAGFTRYQVIFTGQTLPNGLTANAVYIVLNSIYQEILNTAVFRPLDYDYMKSLPPAAQRLYEIVSYQIYAALHFGNPRARLLYSEYCLLSTTTRYFTFKQVKKQMYKIHKPHLQSGYIAKVTYEATVNEAGEPDWWMHYTPGPNAGREYQVFTGTAPSPSLKKTKKDKPAPPTLSPDAAKAPVEKDSLADGPDTQELVAQLVAAELNRGDAERFARAQPEECRRQLEFLSHIKAFKTSRGAYLRRAIEESYGPPPAFVKAQEAQAKSQERQKRADRQQAQQSQQVARREENLATVCQMAARMQQEQPEAFTAFEGYVEAKKSALAAIPKNPALKAKVLAEFETDRKRLELFLEFFRQAPCPLRELAAWLREHSEAEMRAMLAEAG